jgi:septal ring factor EnvC (AmiA/AmiB activator)
MEKNFITIAVTLITVLGSTAAWDFYKKKLDMKKKEESEDKEEKNLYRDDLKDRVSKLELLLAESADEKDKLRDKVIALTADVATLSTKVEFLEKEVARLEDENESLKDG